MSGWWVEWEERREARGEKGESGTFKSSQTLGGFRRAHV